MGRSSHGSRFHPLVMRVALSALLTISEALTNASPVSMLNESLSLCGGMKMKGLLAHRFHAMFITILVLLAISQLSFAQVRTADCSYLIAGRTFAQIFEGYFNFGPDVGVVPNAGGGVVTFERHGKVTGTLTLTVGSIFQAQDLPIQPGSTYTLTWDTSKKPVVCSGTATIIDPVTGPANFQLVVSNDGKNIEMIHTDFGLTAGVTLARMSPGMCSNYSLHSTYSYNAKGWMMPPPTFPPPSAIQVLNGFMPFAFSGAMRFDPFRPAPSNPPGAPAGSAYIEGWDTVSLNGFVVPRTYVGWYKVNRDCTSTQAILDNIGNPPLHIEVFIADGGSLIDVVNVDPVEAGLVLSFTATSVADRRD